MDGIFKKLTAAKKEYDEAVYAYDHSPRESAAVNNMLSCELKRTSYAYKAQLEAAIIALTRELEKVRSGDERY